MPEPKYERLYFSWDDNPAVIEPYVSEDVSRGFFIPLDGDRWVRANNDQYADFPINGSLLPKEEFEEMYGEIGKHLPEVPAFEDET